MSESQKSPSIEDLTPEEANRIIHSHRKVRYGKWISCIPLMLRAPQAPETTNWTTVTVLSALLVSRLACAAAQSVMEPVYSDAVVCNRDCLLAVPPEESQVRQQKPV